MLFFLSGTHGFWPMFVFPTYVCQPYVKCTRIAAGGCCGVRLSRSSRQRGCCASAEIGRPMYRGRSAEVFVNNGDTLASYARSSCSFALASQARTQRFLPQVTTYLDNLDPLNCRHGMLCGICAGSAYPTQKNLLLDH